MPFLHIILSIKDSVQQQIHFNGNVFENKCCRSSQGSLYCILVGSLFAPPKLNFEKE